MDKEVLNGLVSVVGYITPSKGSSGSSTACGIYVMVCVALEPLHVVQAVTAQLFGQCLWQRVSVWSLMAGVAAAQEGLQWQLTAVFVLPQAKVPAETSSEWAWGPSADTGVRQWLVSKDEVDSGGQV